MKEFRRYRFKLYPNAEHEAALLDIKGACCRLYNAALEQRIFAYKRRGVSLSYYDQDREIKVLKETIPEYKRVNSQLLRCVLGRLDKAFKAFFRRVKAGQTPGFPRFKPLQRFKGWDYSTHGNGWRLHLNDNRRNGYLRLQGVGHVRFRGSVPVVGKVKTCAITHRGGEWFASVVFEYEPGELTRECGRAAVGLDWGVKTFLTGAGSNGGAFTVENPRLLNAAQEKLAREQRRLSRKKRGSNNRRKQVKRVARAYGKVANQRDDFHHKTSAWLVRMCALVAVEQLNVKGMTSNGGAHKRGLNRAILDTSPASFHDKLRYKAESAGCRYVEIPTRKVKPTQTCSCCGHQAKKQLDERVHRCAQCGFEVDRDVNAARVILSWALFESPTQLPRGTGEVTPVERPGCGPQ